MVWSARDALKRVAIHRLFLHFGKKIRREREREREGQTKRCEKVGERVCVCLIYIERYRDKENRDNAKEREKERKCVRLLERGTEWKKTQKKK